MQKHNNFLKVLLALLIGCLLLIAMATSGSAQTPTPPSGGAQATSLDNAIKPVTDLIRELAVSVIKFLTFLGGTIFVVTTVFAAFKGTLGSALGNQMLSSNSLMQFAVGVAALILMLVAVPLANNLLTTLTDKLLTQSMEIPNIVEMAQAEGGAPFTANAEDLLQVPAIQETITNFAVTAIRTMVTIGSIASVVAISLGAFDTQIGNMLGGGRLASRGILRIGGSIAALVFLFTSFQLAKLIISSVGPAVLSSISIVTPYP